MQLGLKREHQTTTNTREKSSHVLVKAESHKDKAFHFDQHGRGNIGEKQHGSKHYDHETHEKMFAYHMPDEDKKRDLRRNSHEMVKNGTTKGHLAAESLYHVLSDFEERLGAAEGDRDLTDQILSEFHDWLAYLHAQHDQHGLHKDGEFRRAYTDAHTKHSQYMAEHEMGKEDVDDD
jgi:hypothetical protein